VVVWRGSAKFAHVLYMLLLLRDQTGFAHIGLPRCFLEFCILVFIYGYKMHSLLETESSAPKYSAFLQHFQGVKDVLV
jgi:hypothetical protein